MVSDAHPRQAVVILSGGGWGWSLLIALCERLAKPSRQFELGAGLATGVPTFAADLGFDCGRFPVLDCLKPFAKRVAFDKLVGAALADLKERIIVDRTVRAQVVL
jgi:hypothetical protein